MTNWQPSGRRPAVVLANNFTNRSNEHLSPRLAFSRQIVNEQVESRWCSIERKGRRVFLEKMEKICENEFLATRFRINFQSSRSINQLSLENPCWILLPLSRGLRFARYKSDVIFSTSVLTSGGKREPVHSRNPFCRNSRHINISAEVGHVRWQITEVENKESGEMFQGSRLTHRELETRVDLLNDPSPVSSPLFFFPPPLVFPPPSLTFPPHVVSFARAINIANPKQAAASNCD